MSVTSACISGVLFDIARNHDLLTFILVFTGRYLASLSRWMSSQHTDSKLRIIADSHIYWNRKISESLCFFSVALFLSSVWRVGSDDISAKRAARSSFKAVIPPKKRPNKSASRYVYRQTARSAADCSALSGRGIPSVTIRRYRVDRLSWTISRILSKFINLFNNAKLITSVELIRNTLIKSQNVEWVLLHACGEFLRRIEFV